MTMSDKKQCMKIIEITIHKPRTHEKKNHVVFLNVCNPRPIFNINVNVFSSVRTKIRIVYVVSIYNCQHLPIFLLYS